MVLCYVPVAIVLWLCTCNNGVVVMLLVAMLLSLCTCSNGVVVMYL